MLSTFAGTSIESGAVLVPCIVRAFVGRHPTNVRAETTSVGSTTCLDTVLDLPRATPGSWSQETDNRLCRTGNCAHYGPCLMDPPMSAPDRPDFGHSDASESKRCISHAVRSAVRPASSSALVSIPRGKLIAGKSGVVWSAATFVRQTPFHTPVITGSRQRMHLRQYEHLSHLHSTIPWLRCNGVIRQSRSPLSGCMSRNRYSLLSIDLLIAGAGAQEQKDVERM